MDLVDKVGKLVVARDPKFGGIELVPLSGYAIGTGKERVEYYKPLVTDDGSGLECNCSGEYIPRTPNSYQRLQDRWNGLMGQVRALPTACGVALFGLSLYCTSVLYSYQSYYSPSFDGWSSSRMRLPSDPFRSDRQPPTPGRSARTAAIMNMNMRMR